LDLKSKTFVGKMDLYQDVVSQMHSAAVLTGKTPETKIIGVADGGIGLSEELKKQFPGCILRPLVNAYPCILTNLGISAQP